MYEITPAQSKRTTLHRAFHCNPAAVELTNKNQRISKFNARKKTIDCFKILFD